MLVKLIDAPAVPAVSLDDVKYHLRISPSDTNYDGRLTPYLEMAVSETQGDTGRALITQTWDCLFKTWLAVEQSTLPFGNLQSVTHLKYLDVDGVKQTVSEDDYLVAGIDTDDGKIVFPSDTAFLFPELYDIDQITVRIIVGYGDTSSTVPGNIQSAIKLMVSDIEDGDDSTTSINKLLKQSRLWRGFEVVAGDTDG